MIFPFEKSASSTRSHRLRHANVDAIGPQKPAGSATLCACSFEYSASDDTCAVADSHAGGGMTTAEKERTPLSARAEAIVP